MQVLSEGDTGAAAELGFWTNIDRQLALMLPQLQPMGTLPAPLSDRARRQLESAWRNMLAIREHPATK
jgi:hypothetical protein